MKNLGDNVGKTNKNEPNALAFVGITVAAVFSLYYGLNPPVPGTDPTGYDTTSTIEKNNKKFSELVEFDGSARYARIDSLDNLGKSKGGIMYFDWDNNQVYEQKVKFNQDSPFPKPIGHFDN